MKTLEVVLPDEIHAKVMDVIDEQGVSLEEFVTLSVSNEVVRREARCCSRITEPACLLRDFAEALAAIPDAPPDPGDEIG